MKEPLKGVNTQMADPNEAPSMGGFMSATAGYISDKPIKGVIMVDSPIRPPTYDYSTHVRSGPIRRIKTYPDEESILAPLEEMLSGEGYRVRANN